MDVLQEALEITKGQAQIRNMTTDEVNEMVRTVVITLKDLAGEPVPVTVVQQPPVTPQAQPTFNLNTYGKDIVICRECGKQMKMLTRSHLANHGLTKEEYLAKHGLDKNTPFTAAYIGKLHKTLIKKTKIWEYRTKKAGPEVEPQSQGQENPTHAETT